MSGARDGRRRAWRPAVGLSAELRARLSEGVALVAGQVVDRAPLPRIVRFLGVDDHGPGGNASCPHCGATGPHSSTVNGDTAVSRTKMTSIFATPWRGGVDYGLTFGQTDIQFTL